MKLKDCTLKLLKYFIYLLYGHMLIRPTLVQLQNIKDLQLHYKKYGGNVSNLLFDRCDVLNIRETNITTSEVFAKFNFKWYYNQSYWSEEFEQRYKEQLKKPQKYPLKVFIVPHSHNDPGWLYTFFQYYEMHTKSIINSIICKMAEYTDMTFIWSEISFLQLWWGQASLKQKDILKKLIDSGRFEITTGGWVMTDEANVHVYPMIDQLIEGHQWIKSHLKTKPTFGWSVDPFGHGATIPYLLSASGFDGTIIQRIHFAWKEWFAKHQNGDFIWQPFWKTFNKNNLLTHNMPFHFYTTQDSCGPFKKVCKKFDFLNYYNNHILEIGSDAKLLLEQYSRTASLFSHNVALIPIGHDFSFTSTNEVDEQYRNYKKLIDHINNNKQYFNAEISFGTPKDYFREIKNRTDQFPTLKGDFFVYADISHLPSPSYWSGYFSTRPFYKILSTELEHNLRSCEILFTLAYNIARQNKYNNLLKLLEIDYKKLISARRNLGLFQHHDAITGTSKKLVMEDYGIRLFKSIRNAVKLQEFSIEILLQNKRFDNNFLVNDLERKNFTKLPKKRIIAFADSNVTSFVIFNSLAQKRIEILSIRTSTPHVLVMNENGLPVQIQVNPVFNIINHEDIDEINICSTEYEILLLAELPPLSLLTFRVELIDKNKKNLTTVYCRNCVGSNTRIEGMNIIQNLPSNIQLENSKMTLLFSNQSGFLESIIRKNGDLPMKCAIMFAVYMSSGSGAYLFKTYPTRENAERNILYQYSNEIFVTSGQFSSEVTVVYGSFLSHTIRIFHTKTYLDNAIYIENYVDYGEAPHHSNEELFMRFVTKIRNGPIPEFYSDQNGFQFQHRIKVPSIGVEGNYFPITSAAFIQDQTTRLTLLTTHSQGAASLRTGELEVILDRRTSFDDERGMDENVTDNKLTRQNFLVIIEDVKPTNNYQVSSLLAGYLGNNLRYPPNIYIVDDEIISRNLSSKKSFIKYSFPCDLHLLNVRTLSDEHSPTYPSRSALVLLHRQGYDCYTGEKLQFCNNTIISAPDLFFNGLKVESIESTSLTGLQNFGPIKTFHRILIEPMDIKTFNLTFDFEI